MADALDLWLDGRFAGKLMRGETDQVEFLYDEDYLDLRSPTPLSATMPTSQIGHGPDVVMPWLSNLLPDADEVRTRWAAKFGERRTDPFTLLAHMGEDAPGSVQVVPEKVVPSDAGELSPMSERDIARRVRAILDDPDQWVDDTDDDGSRFSLGGQQGKFALAEINGEWFEPNGRAPSTHIVKPGMVLKSGHTDGHVQAVEFVTMRAARTVGVRAARVDILDFAGVPAFVTTRFDRRATSGGDVVRIHQEDFCQALGIRPALKYEEDGGPTMADMASLVNDTSSPAYRTEDQIILTKLFVYKLLTAGVDAHAKNHSMLHLSGITRLAPAYDLISAHGLWSEDRVMFTAKAAVKYGKEHSYRQIHGRNLARTADGLGAPRSAFAIVLEDMADEKHGLAKLEAVCEHWVGLVVKHGGAMVHTRSEKGYLQRLRSSTPYLTVQGDALLPAIAEAAAELGVEDPADEALFLWNIMFDPREIFDLLNTVGLSEEQASRRLFAAFCGAMIGWATDKAGISITERLRRIPTS